MNFPTKLHSLSPRHEPPRFNVGLSWPTLSVRLSLGALAFLLPLLFLPGCSSGFIISDVPPFEDWNTARAAYDAAKDADAPRYVPALWFNAEQTYREAQRAYKERDYKESKEEFISARQLCEEAENAARLARQLSGEVVP